MARLLAWLIPGLVFGFSPWSHGAGRATGCGITFLVVYAAALLVLGLSREEKQIVGALRTRLAAVGVPAATMAKGV